MIIKKGSPSHELPADDVLKGCERGERGWWRRRLIDGALGVHRGSRGCLRSMGSQWASHSSILEPRRESIDQRHCWILGVAARGKVRSNDGRTFDGVVQRWASIEKRRLHWGWSLFWRRPLHRSYSEASTMSLALGIRFLKYSHGLQSTPPLIATLCFHVENGRLCRAFEGWWAKLYFESPRQCLGLHFFLLFFLVSKHRWW